MDELKQARISVSLHLAAAIAVGWTSWIISLAYTKWICAALGFLVLGAISLVLMKRMKVTGKWLSGNGTIIYIFAWAVAWVLFYNLA